MEKTRDPVSSKIWPDSTCAISVRRKGQILLVAGSLVFSTTYMLILMLFSQNAKILKLAISDIDDDERGHLIVGLYQASICTKISPLSSKVAAAFYKNN